MIKQNNKNNINNTEETDVFANFTPEQKQEFVYNQGRKIGFLFSKVNWPKEVKQAWLTLIPSMGPQELDELLLLLEEAYIKQETSAIDLQFMENVKSTISKYKEKQDAAADKALAELNELEKEIDALEKANKINK